MEGTRDRGDPVGGEDGMPWRKKFQLLEIWEKMEATRKAPLSLTRSILITDILQLHFN